MVYNTKGYRPIAGVLFVTFYTLLSASRIYGDMRYHTGTASSRNEPYNAILHLIQTANVGEPTLIQGHDLSDEHHEQQLISIFQGLRSVSSRDDTLLLLNRIQHVWDGTEWETSDQYIYQYDISNNMISTIRRRWGDSAWVNIWRHIYTYDTNNNAIIYLSQTWDGASWVNNDLRITTFDANNNIVSSLGQNWNGTAWINSMISHRTYDANNNLLSTLAQFWVNLDWENHVLHTYIYDANNNMVSYVRQIWDGFEWVNDLQRTYNYDVNNNMVTEITHYWNDSTWVFTLKHLFTYNTNNAVLSKIDQNWSGSIWTNVRQTLYNYDADNNMISLLVQVWNTSLWENSVKALFTYDTQNNRLSYIRLRWGGSGWVNDWQWLYTYDLYGNLLSAIVQDWNGSNWVNTNLDIQNWGTLDVAISSIQNQEIVEDSTLEIVLDSYSPIYGALLELFAFSDTSAVFTAIVDSSILLITPGVNWNGSSLITVIVSDNYGSSDTTDFMLAVNPVNDPPSRFSVLYPTVEDTFSTHIESNSLIEFIWHSSLDVDDTIAYRLTIELEFFGNTYTDIHNDIVDTTYGIYSNSLDALLSALNLQQAILSWHLRASDGEFLAYSDTGQFVLIKGLMDLQEEHSLPGHFMLHQNYPNPFNPLTTIKYDLPEQSRVVITIYDLLGRQVRTLVNKTQEPGYKAVTWNGTDERGRPAGAGIYLYQIKAGDFIQMRKMVLLK